MTEAEDPNAQPVGAPSALVVGSADGLAGEVFVRMARTRPVVLAATDRARDVAEGPNSDRAHVVGITLSGGQDLVRACERACGSSPLGLVVYAPQPPGWLQRQPLAGLDNDTWDSLVEAPLRDLLTSLQAVHGHLSSGGRVVVVVPTVGLLGGDGLVAASTAGEGLRSLAKSAARSWGLEGINVHVVAVAESCFGGANAGSDGSPKAALEDPGIAEGADAVLATAMLPDAVTGATIFVDGGRLMLP